jgi:hypothetical protein
VVDDEMDVSERLAEVDANGQPRWFLYEDIAAINERDYLIPISGETGLFANLDQFQTYFTGVEARFGETIPVDPIIGGFPDSYVAYEYLPVKRGGQRLDMVDALLMERAYGHPFIEKGEEKTPKYRQSTMWDITANMSTLDIYRFQNLTSRAMMYPERLPPASPDPASLSEADFDSRTRSRPQSPGYFSGEDRDVLLQVMETANASGDSFWDVLEQRANAGDRWRRANPRVTDPIIIKQERRPFSPSASLRNIPGAKTVADETKERFENRVGRAPTQEELDDMAEELTGYYRQRNQMLIDLERKAYEGEDTLLTDEQMVAIEDPSRALRFDIDQKWAKEINLSDRRETNAESFGRMISATLGGRPGIGTLSAPGVQQIERLT